MCETIAPREDFSSPTQRAARVALSLKETLSHGIRLAQERGALNLADTHLTEKECEAILKNDFGWLSIDRLIVTACHLPEFEILIQMGGQILITMFSPTVKQHSISGDGTAATLKIKG